MRKFWLGFGLGLIALPLAAACYVTLGIAPAETKAPPLPFERLIAGTALSNRIHRDAPSREPARFSTADLLEGARVYKNNCAVCHGVYQQTAQQGAASIGQSMFPGAPQLLTPDGTTRQPIGVTFWKVDNGIRLTGMPSFESLLSEKEKWDVSALLSQMNSMPLEVEQELRTVEDVRAQTSPTPKRSIAAVPK